MEISTSAALSLALIADVSLHSVLKIEKFKKKIIFFQYRRGRANEKKDINFSLSCDTKYFFKDFSLTVHDGDSNTDDEVLDLAYCSDDIGRQCWRTGNLWRLLKLW